MIDRETVIKPVPVRLMLISEVTGRSPAAGVGLNLKVCN